jgi:hypothetical protein
MNIDVFLTPKFFLKLQKDVGAILSFAPSADHQKPKSILCTHRATFVTIFRRVKP